MFYVYLVPDVPLPPEPVPPAKFLNDGEPLPPGVDLPEIIAYNKPKVCMILIYICNMNLNAKLISFPIN